MQHDIVHNYEIRSCIQVPNIRMNGTLILLNGTRSLIQNHTFTLPFLTGMHYIKSKRESANKKLLDNGIAKKCIVKIMFNFILKYLLM